MFSVAILTACQENSNNLLHTPDDGKEKCKIGTAGTLVIQQKMTCDSSCNMQIANLMSLA